MNEPTNPEPKTAAGDADFLAMQEKVKGSNIDETTLLATDYLNHFNEIVMLLEMIPDMPEILEDVKAWQPKSYMDHFKSSTIAEKDLAIEAYDFVPAVYREPFEQTIEQINNSIASTVVPGVVLRTPQVTPIRSLSRITAGVLATHTPVSQLVKTSARSICS